MSMELTKLEFVVDTSQLKTATEELSKLRQAISDLNTAQTKKTKDEKAAESQAKALAKAEKEKAKEVERLAKETEKKAAADAKAAKAAQDAAEKGDPLEKLYGKLSNRLTDLVAGFSSSEASILHQARSYGAAGAALDPFIEKLKETRDFLKNPFDASLGSIQSITAEFQKLEQRADLAAKGIVLTTKQLNEYSKLSSQVWQETKGLGLDPSKGMGQTVFNKELEKQQAAYLKVAAAVNSASGSEKELARSKRESENAVRALVREEEKMLSILTSVNAEQRQGVNLNEAAAQSIARYEQNLKRAGVTGADAAKKLELYKNQQALVMAVEQKRQAQYLSRGLQPQIGDVVVSLAAGQNPLTVMLQQGDQIRGLIAQTGVEGKLLQKTMQDAFTQTLTSVKNTAVAMGSVVGGAFVSLGNSIKQTYQAPFQYLKAFTEVNQKLTDGLITQERADRLLEVSKGRLIQSFMSFSKIAIGGAVAALVTLGIAMSQVIDEESRLSKSLALSGGALGLNKDSAYAMANALATTGISVGKTIAVISEMSNASSLASKDISMITNTAVTLEKVAGIAIKDTVKEFEKLAKEPSKALTEIAIKTGLITPEVLKLVTELENNGRTADAAAVAMKAYADASKSAAGTIRSEYGSLELIANSIKNSFSGMWDAILNIGRMTPLATKLVEAQNKLQEIKTKGVSWYQTKAAYQEEIAYQQEIVDSIKNSIDLQKKDADQKVANVKAAQTSIDSQKLAEDLYKRENKLIQEKVSRQGYINAAIAEEYKRRKDAASVTKEELADIARIAGMEFDVKQDKTPKSKVNKDAEKAQKELNAAFETYNDLLGRSSSLSSSYNNEVAQLDLLLKNKKISQAEYNQAFAELLKKQPVYIQQQKDLADAEKERVSGIELINKLLGKGDDLGKDYYNTQDKLFRLLEQGFDSDAILKAFAALEATTPAAIKAANATKTLAAIQAEVAKGIAGVDLQREDVSVAYTMDFKTEDQKAALLSLSKYKKSIAEADNDYAKSAADVALKLEGQNLQDALAAYKNYSDAKKALAQDTYNREKYLQSDLYRFYDDGFKALTKLGQDFGKAVGDSFIKFAKDGEFSFGNLRESFKDMVDNMVYDLIRLQVQKQVTGLFDIAIGGLKNILMGGSLDTTSASMNTSQLTNPVLQAKGGAWENGLQAFAKGGSFTNSIVDSPTMFKFAKGTGLMGEAGPEAIMPLRRDSSGSLGVVASGTGSSTNVDVVVNNYGKEQATTTETVDSRGNRKIEVTIGDIAAAEIGRSGSSSQKAMGSTFGMRPQLIRR